MDENGNIIKATAFCKLPEQVLLADYANLYQYDYRKKQIKTLTHLKLTDSFPIREIIPWDNHTLLCISQWKGIILLDMQSGKRKESPLPNEKEITQVLIDRKGYIWITAYNRGITCFDRQGNIQAIYNTENQKLSHNVILCLSEHEGKIWAGTDGGGINIINPQTGNVKILKHLSGDKNSLPINSIQSLFQRDGQENTWAGSVKGGLINIRHSIVHSYSDVPLGYTNGLSEKAILSFFQETGSEDIWIGTDGGGVNRFNPHTKQFIHYPATYGEKVVSLCRYSQQELLISLFSKGVFFFNKQTGKIRPINEGSAVINQIALYGRKGINLYQDETESVLLLSSEIYRYYLKSGRLQQLSDSQISIEGQTLPIGYDSLKTYLYDLKHIYTIDHRNNKIETIYTSTQENYIECVTKNAKGIFWIGFSDKILRYDSSTQLETQIDAPQLKKITALICDQHQRVWIGTNEELFVWLDNENKLISLDESDGAEDNEFLKKAVWASPQGDIYLGGINGMLYIDGNKSSITIPTSPELKLTDIISNNKSYLSDIDQDENSLDLSFDNKTVIIKVMAYESNIFRKKVYRWYIDGKEESTTDSKLPELTLRSLTPGTYHISVSCSTKDGSWTTPQQVITLHIPPVWYQTWWFNLLWILLAAALLIAFILYLLNRKEERMKADLQEHKQKIYEEKVRFLININHELRTPLTLIYTPLNQLVKTIPQDNPIYPTLRSILKQSKRMKELLNMVLNLRKMEIEQSKLNIQSYPLNEWIKEIATDFKYEEEDKHITILYDLSPEIGEVEFDQERHIIILTNLIVNAFKHSSTDSSITLRTELTEDKQSVRISVIDQGPGLQGVDTEKLFTRFYQGVNERNGSGIGLSYSKILVEMHKGKIGVYNNPDKGACFWYELPVHAQSSEICPPREYLNILTEAAPEEEKYTPIANSINTKDYSCLFVDDNESIRQMVTEALKDNFKNLYIASNGKEALQIALKEIPDIVISDIMMPEMNGYELCRRIKENLNINHIQVILLTARTDEQSHLDGYKTGADAYMEKPFEINSLLENVRNRLYLREQIRLKYTHNSITAETEKPITSVDDAFLFKLNKVIVENMENDELNVEFISQELGISRASLYNRLKALTGMGASEYVNKLRIEKAMELLRQTELNMTEIAERTGFSTSRYFSTAFKKYTGITPTQYKESPDNLNTPSGK
ncbi:hybrid sensor histidine kinase/response regulator transcription factor [Phocaeicola sp. HCN-6420]|uniref:hybrid sensor histidine kinase/response regulator transcription factor n=1 Tax=Phocaeicola sp. HCN-6420 TaxID=3134673 RepID=UPI0030C39C49